MKQRLIVIVYSSAPAIPALFAKNTAAKRTAAAKEIEAQKERECTGRGKYLADRIATAKDREIDDWYADQDYECEKKREREANKCLFEEVCAQLCAWAPNYEFHMQRLRILWPDTERCHSSRTTS